MTNIVMLVRNRYTLTKQALESLRRHTDCNDYTLTLVNDGSTDFRVVRLLHDEVLSSSGNTTLLTVPFSTHQLGRLKNLGAWWSQQHFGESEYIYFSDNDVYFTENWLRKLLEVASASRLYRFMVWGGQAHPYHKSIYPPTVGHVIPEWIATGWTEHDCLAGVSMLMLSKTWNEYGPFVRDSAPGVCQSEDFALTKMIRNQKGRVGVTYPPVVYHTGVTNSEGKPAIGSELFPRVPGVIYE